MPDFVMVFVGGEPEKPADLPAHYAAYGEFMKFLGAGGHFKSGLPVDGGAGRLVTADGIQSSGDFMSTKERIGGLIVVTAESLDAAAELGRRNPIITNGGRVIVRPLKAK